MVADTPPTGESFMQDIQHILGHALAAMTLDGLRANRDTDEASPEVETSNNTRGHTRAQSPLSGLN